MKHNIQRQREEVAELKRRLEEAEQRLGTTVRSCAHKWGNVIPDHIYHPSYEIPGDPPGTMGVDWRGPTYVPSRTEKRWKRVCQECGEVEYTNRTTQTVTETPAF